MLVLVARLKNDTHQFGDNDPGKIMPEKLYREQKKRKTKNCYRIMNINETFDPRNTVHPCIKYLDSYLNQNAKLYLIEYILFV